MNKKIKIVSKKKLTGKLLRWQAQNGDAPRARYLTQDKGVYIAADNSSGDFYVEEFDDLRKAIAWFDGEEKVEEK